jgi:hypothetical protein
LDSEITDKELLEKIELLKGKPLKKYIKQWLEEYNTRKLNKDLANMELD